MILIRILLLPISLLYGLIVQLRNILYEWHILSIKKFDQPVISVGNIVAGGTGKTPFTIYLSNLLINQGKKVAVVSRGYGRQSSGFHLVSDGIDKKGNTKIHGDEPVLISLLASKAIVAVGENRGQVIDKLLSMYDIDVIVLDDGFQHRAVYRDIDIVLIKDKNQLMNRFVLPSGMLREFKFNLTRADIIINRDEDVDKSEHFNCSFQSDGIVDSNFKSQGNLGSLSGKSCVAFAGIADPKNFEKNLTEKGMSVAEFIPYKDHYNFTLTDIQFLMEICIKNDCKYLLCTQKDLIKIREIDQLNDSLKKNNLSLLAISFRAAVKNEKSFLKKMESHLDWL